MNNDIRGSIARQHGGDTTYTTDANSKTLPQPDDFPIDALPRATRRLVREAAASIGCPADLIGVPVLVTLASAIGNSRVLKLKGGWEEGATIYAASVAPPGTKKTPAYNEAIRPAANVQARFFQDYQRELRLCEEEQDEDSHNSELPTLQRTTVGDTTIEALCTILNANKRGVLMVRDELSGWVRSMNQYKGKGADRQFYLEAWGNSPYTVDRKGAPEPIILQRPFICVYGTIQPEVLSELDTGRDDGLLDRFLFACPLWKATGWTDYEISDEARDDYHQLYVKLRELEMDLDEHGNPCPKPILFAPDAKEVFAEVMDEIVLQAEEPGFPSRLQGPWAKMPGHLARLSLVCALCRSVDRGLPERVESRDVLAATVLLDYFKHQARRIYVGLYGEDPHDRLTADLVAFLQEHDGHWKGSATELQKQLLSSVKPDSPDVLSKTMGVIAARTPTLTVKHGWEGKNRALTLTLDNGVDSVGGVGDSDDCACSGRGCLECLTQELPFGAN